MSPSRSALHTRTHAPRTAAAGLDGAGAAMVAPRRCGRRTDGDFSEERFCDTVNAALANNLGNMLNRTLSLLAKFCDGKARPAPRRAPRHGVLRCALRCLRTRHHRTHSSVDAEGGKRQSWRGWRPKDQACCCARCALVRVARVQVVSDVSALPESHPIRELARCALHSHA